MSLHTSMDHVQMNYDPKVIPLNLRRKSKMIVMSVSTEPVATLINTQFFHFRKFDRSKNWEPCSHMTWHLASCNTRLRPPF